MLNRKEKLDLVFKYTRTSQIYFPARNLSSNENKNSV